MHIFYWVFQWVLCERTESIAICTISISISSHDHQAIKFTSGTATHSICRYSSALECLVCENEVPSQLKMPARWGKETLRNAPQLSCLFAPHDEFVWKLLVFPIRINYTFVVAPSFGAVLWKHSNLKWSWMTITSHDEPPTRCLRRYVAERFSSADADEIVFNFS